MKTCGFWNRKGERWIAPELGYQEGPNLRQRVGIVSGLCDILHLSKCVSSLFLPNLLLLSDPVCVNPYVGQSVRSFAVIHREKLAVLLTYLPQVGAGVGSIFGPN